MSDHPPIHQALAHVMGEVTHVGKTGHNKQQGYNFRGIDGVLNAVGPALRKHGVIPLPELTAMSSQTIEVGKNRTLMREVTVEVRYTFVGPAGDSLTVKVPGEAMDSGDKAVSKAMSVALRTALIQALALPTDEPDPDESSYERAPAPETATEPAVDLDALPVISDDQKRVLTSAIERLPEPAREVVKAEWTARLPRALAKLPEPYYDAAQTLIREVEQRAADGEWGEPLEPFDAPDDERPFTEDGA